MFYLAFHFQNASEMSTLFSRFRRDSIYQEKERLKNSREKTDVLNSKGIHSVRAQIAFVREQKNDKENIAIAFLRLCDASF